VQVQVSFGSFVKQVLTRRERRVLVVLLAVLCLGYARVWFTGDAGELPGNLDSLDRAFAERARIMRQADAGDPARADRGAGASPGRTPAGSESPCDINRAAFEDLLSLPRIGPTRAAAILDYRRRRGPFHRLEDLLEVQGIGPATLAGLRGLVRVGAPPADGSVADSGRTGQPAKP